MVYLNGTALWGFGEVTETIYSSQVMVLRIYCSNDTFGFDDFVVSNTVDITQPSLIPGFPIAAITLGLGAGLGLGVITRRNRGSPTKDSSR
jgi:hypothetical protein